MAEENEPISSMDPELLAKAENRSRFIDSMTSVISYLCVLYVLVSRNNWIMTFEMISMLYDVMYKYGAYETA